MNRLAQHREFGEHRSVTSRTYERLRNAIVTARFRPGEKLRIDSLREEFDASLGAVREALAALTAERLVTAEPQRGFSISLISRKDLLDLTEARIQIELTCLDSSIRHGDLDWEGRVLSASHQLSKVTCALHDVESPDAETWHRYHALFHDAITSACTNDWWLRLRSQLYDQSERYRRLSGPIPVEERDIDAEHRTIADAVLARDAEGAKALLARHFMATTEILLGSPTLFADERPGDRPATATAARTRRT